MTSLLPRPRALRKCLSQTRLGKEPAALVDGVCHAVRILDQPISRLEQQLTDANASRCGHSQRPASARA
jgi:hypothetical protein